MWLGCLLSLFALAPIPWELVQGCVPECPETQVVSVLAAVSFGTEDLTDDEKGLFEEARPDRLVGVTNWTRPARTELGPFQEGTPDDWKMKQYPVPRYPVQGDYEEIRTAGLSAGRTY